MFRLHLVLCIPALVLSQCHVYAICFDLRSAFDLVPHTLLLDTLNVYRLSDGYVIWLRSYIHVTSYYSFVPIHGHFLDNLSSVLAVTQGSVFGLLLFHVFINKIGSSIKYLRYIHLLTISKYSKYFVS